SGPDQSSRWLRVSTLPHRRRGGERPIPHNSTMHPDHPPSPSPGRLPPADRPGDWRARNGSNRPDEPPNACSHSAGRNENDRCPVDVGKVQARGARVFSTTKPARWKSKSCTMVGKRFRQSYPRKRCPGKALAITSLTPAFIEIDELEHRLHGA